MAKGPTARTSDSSFSYQCMGGCEVELMKGMDVKPFLYRDMWGL